MTYSELILSHSPSNYWKLGESSGLTAADSAGSAPGTISGGVTLAQAGALADGTTAMTFNGTTGKIVAGSGSLPAASTLEVWLNHAAAVQSPVVTITQAGVEQPTLYIDAAGKLWVYDAPNTGLSSVSLLATGGWHHVVVVWDTGTLRLYLDGVVDSTIGSATRTVIGVGPIAIGHDPAFGAGTSAFFNGSLDEVAIYPRALTPTEISDHYAARLTTAVPSAGCDHTTVWSKHLATLSAPTVESERAYLATLYGEPGGSDMSTLVSRWLQAITCGTAVATPAAPTLSLVSPNTGTQGTMVTVTLTGTGFIAGATGVSVNGVGISVVNIQVLSPTSLTADLAIAAAAPPTARSITVTHAGGSASQAFTVSAAVVVLGTVVLLVGADTAVVDESLTARTLTLGGNAARTTTPVKYGAGALTFDGTGDFVSAAWSPDFSFGAGDFTIEGWFRFLVKTDLQAMLGWWHNTFTAQCSWFFYISGGFLRFRDVIGTTTRDLQVAWVPTLGQWYHLAVDKSGTIARVYVDGVVVATNPSFTGTLNDGTVVFTLGRLGNDATFASFDFNGQMDEVRVVRGGAQYAGAFTPPTGPLPRP
jgi:hypothetical protein